MALLSVLLILITVGGLCAALAVNSRTETLIARNQQTAAEARAAAEAGLSHALEVTITELRNWQTNGFPTPSAAMSDLLLGPDDASGSMATDADNGSLEAFGIPRPPATLGLAGLPAITYMTRLFDEDDPVRGFTLLPADEARILENGDPVSDNNTRIVVASAGFASSEAMQYVDATVTPLELPALVTNGDLLILPDFVGNTTVTGTEGSVHSNGILMLWGNVNITGDATASVWFWESGATIGGMSGGSYPNMGVPVVRAADHRPKADFILTADGRLTNPVGGLICDAGSGDKHACMDIGYGWEYEGANGWELEHTHATIIPGTYYVEGDAETRGNQGTAVDPLDVTIIAEGSVYLRGNTYLEPDWPGFLVVADGDLRTDNTVTANIAEALILVREQVRLEGTFSFTGQVLSEGATTTSNLVIGSNLIYETVSLTYNGLAPVVDFTVEGWYPPHAGQRPNW